MAKFKDEYDSEGRHVARTHANDPSHRLSWRDEPQPTVKETKMKLKIFEETPKDDAVFLRLVPLCDGVRVVACDNEGETLDGGFLCSIDSSGVGLYEDVSLKLGIALDPDGRIKIS